MNLAQLGGLTNLQELRLTAPDGDITGPSSVPGLVFPASLTRLVFWSAGFDGEILSLLPAGLRELDLEGPNETGSLLPRISQLRQLVHLYMSLDVWPPAGPAYAALTASSSLERLGLNPTPPGVWHHIFPPTRKLMHLTCLLLGANGKRLDAPSSLCATDVSHITSGCPSLRFIHISCLQHGMHVSELCKLTSLWALNMHYGACDTAALGETLKGVAAVTQLEHLVVTLRVDQDLPLASLLPLTSLTTLDTLKFKCTFGTALEDWYKKPLCVELEQVGC
jgi:hypothetical protein